MKMQSQAALYHLTGFEYALLFKYYSGRWPSFVPTGDFNTQGYRMWAGFTKPETV